MNVNEFYAFCNTVIEEYVKEILEEDKDIGCLTFNKRSLNNIYVHYEKKRVEVRKRYMQDSAKLVDRHKIAACMMYAILKAHVFKVERLISNVPEKLLLANEYLAFYVAINIVEMFKRAEKEYEFHEDYVLFFPIAYHINENYEQGTFVYNTCKSLSFIKNIKYFDVIAYSTIFFQLEKYTDTLLTLEKRGEMD